MSIGEFSAPSGEQQPIDLRDFIGLMNEWAEAPWNGDEGIAAFSRAIINLLPSNIEAIYTHGIDEIYGNLTADGANPSDQEFLLLIGNYLGDYDDPVSIDSHTSATASYKGRKLYHAVRFVVHMIEDKELMDRTFETRGLSTPELKYSYPDDYDKPEAYTDLFRVIMENPELGDLLTLALERFRIRTTALPRYLVPRLALLAEFGDKSFRLGSVGVGSGHGEKALISDAVLDQVEVMAPTGHDSGPKADAGLTAYVNSVRNNHLEISELLGFDLIGINDVAQDVWIKSSLLLREHKDKALMKKYDNIAAVKDPRLSFHILDFTSEEAVDEFIENYSQRTGEAPELDAFLAITMFYQLKSEEEQAAVKRNMAKFVKKNGFILIQDSVDGLFEGEYNYLAVKYYPHKPEIGSRVVAYSRDDRCQQIIIQDELADISTGAG